MPHIGIDRIVSFSSEDSAHAAKNLLSSDPAKKWKCKTAGEKNAIVVLQFEQPTVITGVDIGNEHSAYIEILVSRSTSDDYKVLLVMSSFMTPLESRQSQNINKVRMFKTEDFSDPERNEKWDRVKIVCTQPFNRHVQYGLSFVRFYASTEKDEMKPACLTIGKFVVRPESPDNITAGSLFARRKELQEETLKGAAAIREATLLAHMGSPVNKKLKHNLPTTPKLRPDHLGEKKSPKARNRDELLYTKEEDEKNDKIDAIIEKKMKEKGETMQKEKEKKQMSGNKKNVDKKESNKNSSDAETSKRRLQPRDDHPKSKKMKKTRQTKPFAKLLDGVVLVISGIQNPDRANLRSMALSMGAKYKSDWDNTCTHLVCAFANTPKFNQVKGKGKIVKRSWLEDSYNERKRLPWRRYALDKADAGAESEEEIWEEVKDTLEPVTLSDSELVEEGSDTEDRVKDILARRQGEPPDIFKADTDFEATDSDDCLDDRSLEIKDVLLKDFFRNKIFYIDSALDEDYRNKIKQYVVAYNGLLVENLDASIEIIITRKDNANVFKDMLPNAVCVSPDWIWRCHNSKSVVEMDEFIL
ncbi:DNA repair protein XRCC1 [Cylas formicarius]|uniref:DNA repair protein XRCC1 n=1 Tax=Cylas formicarius TaxID=197179 RepID=UPI00295891E0|nr:DNA repair protein XRCC1 [Cylas formicarius]